MSDLKILLTADLNVAKSVEEINKAIDKIQRQVHKLKLEVDTKPLENAQVSLNGLSNAVEKTQRKIVNATSQASKLSGLGVAELDAKVKEINSVISKYGEVAKVTVQKDGNDNLMSATIQYKDATKKLVTERMAWQKTVAQQLVDIDEHGQQIFEEVQKNVFKTVGTSYTENMKAFREEIDKIYSNAKNGYSVADGGKEFLDPSGAESIKAKYQEVMDIIEKARNENREVSNEEKIHIDEINKKLDEEIKKNKELTAEIKRRNNLGTNVTSLTGTDFKDTNAIKQQIADYYNKTLSLKTPVTADSVAITKNIIDDKTKQQVAEFEAIIETGKNKLTKFKGSADEATQSLYQLGDGIQSTANRNLDFTNKLKGAIQSIPVWMIGMTAFYQGLHFITDGIAYVNEMNKSLTELSIVFNQSQSEVSQWASTFHQLGMEMSVSAQDLASGAVEFARQGLNQTQMVDMMTTATKYAKISNMEFIESAEILTATVNSMGVSAEHAADIYSYMGDATATGNLCA